VGGKSAGDQNYLKEEGGKVRRREVSARGKWKGMKNQEKGLLRIILAKGKEKSGSCNSGTKGPRKVSTEGRGRRVRGKYYGKRFHLPKKKESGHFYGGGGLGRERDLKEWEKRGFFQLFIEEKESLFCLREDVVLQSFPAIRGGLEEKGAGEGEELFVLRDNQRVAVSLFDGCERKGREGSATWEIGPYWGK